MPVVNIFPTPIYTIRAAGEKLDTIQDELMKTYNKMNKKHLPYSPDAHEISTDKDGNFFTGDLLKAYDCKNFLKFLDHAVKQYIYGVENNVTSGSNVEWVNPCEYWITESWFTKTLKGHYAPHHNHGDSSISGVYYLNTNGEDGRIKILSPHRYMVGNYIYGMITRGSEQTIQLQNGVLGLWPSVLDHCTEENKTDHERLSLSFNICFKAQGQQEQQHKYY